jgi:hypothetical protein
MILMRAMAGRKNAAICRQDGFDTSLDTVRAGLGGALCTLGHG